MKLTEALEHAYKGKKIRKTSWSEDGWWCFDDALRNEEGRLVYLETEDFEHEWEIEEPKVEMTLSQARGLFSDGWDAANDAHPYIRSQLKALKDAGFAEEDLK